MREIKINGQLVDISTDEVIEIVRQSGIFDFSGLTGSFTANFSLPYKHSAVNQLVFGFVGNPRRVTRGVWRGDIEFFWQAALIYSGFVEVEQVGDALSCGATLELGALTEVAKSRKLTELELGNFAIAVNYLSHYPPETYDLCMPLITNATRDDQLFWSSRQFMNIWADTLTPSYPSLSWVQNTYWSWVNNRSVTPIAPCWYWRAALREVLRAIGYKLGACDIPDDEIIVCLRDMGVRAPGTGIDYVPAEVPKAACLPDVSVADFINATRLWFNVAVIVRGHVVDVVSLNRVLAGEWGTANIELDKVELNLGQQFEGYTFAADTADAAYHAGGKTWGQHDYPAWDSLIGKDIVAWDGALATGQVVDAPRGDELLLDSTGRYWSKTEGEDFTTTVQLFNRGTQIGISPEMDKGIVCPVTPIGYTDRPSDISVSFTNKMGRPLVGSHPKYQTTQFSVWRVAKVFSNGVQQEARAVGDGFNLSDVGENSTWRERWLQTLDYLREERERIQAVLVGDAKPLFVNTIDWATIYICTDGTRIIIEEIVVPYGHDRIGDVKIKGSTIR